MNRRKDRSADLLIGSFPAAYRTEPIRRSAFRFMGAAGFTGSNVGGGARFLSFACDA
jgi:hypothetical protein